MEIEHQHRELPPKGKECLVSPKWPACHYELTALQHKSGGQWNQEENTGLVTLEFAKDLNPGILSSLELSQWALFCPDQ